MTKEKRYFDQLRDFKDKPSKGERLDSLENYVSVLEKCYLKQSVEISELKNRLHKIETKGDIG
jgi:hypothetical protein